MPSRMAPVLLLLYGLLLPHPTSAGSVRLVSNVFGSNMVLQHGRPAPVWGWAAPGAKVAVTFGGASLPAATADADGLWKVVLPPQPPSLAAHTIGVESGSEKITLANVVFGEVILCSGQSNMVCPPSCT